MVAVVPLPVDAIDVEGLGLVLVVAFALRGLGTRCHVAENSAVVQSHEAFGVEAADCIGGSLVGTDAFASVEDQDVAAAAEVGSRSRSKGGQAGED